MKFRELSPLAKQAQAIMFAQFVLGSVAGVAVAITAERMYGAAAIGPTWGFLAVLGGAIVSGFMARVRAARLADEFLSGAWLARQR